MALNSLSAFFEKFNAKTSPKAVTNFITSGGDPNEKAPYSGHTILNMAIEHYNLPCIQALIENGAAIDVLGSPLPLFHALEADIDDTWQATHSWKNLDFSRTVLLIDLGADWRIKNKAGQSIKDAASLYGSDVLSIFNRLVEPHCI